MASENMKAKLTWRTKFCYGVGHILNDLCASMWFSYFILYFHKVIEFSNAGAGTLLLVGQVADALATPFVGVESDKTGNYKYGRRKIWHLVGVLAVVCSFPFVFNDCIHCEHSHDWAKFFYFTPFVVIFQFGWASTQISHLSLIPELTDDENEKITLNAIRYASTVCSNIFVFLVTWVILSMETGGDKKLGPQDSNVFMYVVFIVVGTGLLFVLIFHIGVKEPRRCCTHVTANKSSKRAASNWILWFKEPQFYQIAVLYMCTRLTVNITQVYIPMYTLETLGLGKEAIATIPLVVYISGFLSTFFSKPLNKGLGRKITFCMGLIVVLGCCVWMKYLKNLNESKDTGRFVYVAAAMLGVGGSTLLVTVLTMTADLIGENVETGAFVYGAMSFVDKLSNGLAVQLIQIFHPCKGSVCCIACDAYYRDIMVYVAGGTSIVSLLTLLTMAGNKIGLSTAEDSTMEPNVQQRLLSGTTSASTSVPKPLKNCSSEVPPVAYQPQLCNHQSYGTVDDTQKPDLMGSIQKH